MSDSDEELARLVPLAVDGDRRAMQQVMRIIHPQVLRYCRARIGGGKTPTAEDVAQEVCLAVASSMQKFVDRGRPFMAFVYGIAFNKVADAHRFMGKDRLHPSEEIPEELDLMPTPEDAALESDGCNAVRGMLDTLNDKARNIIILRVFVGLTAEETAQALGSTPGAVRVAQHRALAQLRKRMENEDSRE
ncbi:sigma-70 family RNA polymerase sigma factor [Corynebacterium pseudodiphtheriticum]|uniref:sigma-70 family RNA polymerase sigma factor n=1 Tax=Corynebacterium pseudodiphtheriticum TaxID=37637 RepID=UPI001F623CBF|nr:sigma-70 family RNA polymerase sigma factor [Corynebacterium pseudodiphtheriticum]MDK8477935.1 sigma-70 family RNA polymerase sigma factor [Corynebacterium pseudodiphtheriticum]MDK8486254.1 sigma-70 family RNA polymerase sigma factor [Corynebacterium pseudodiphtheriticum]MDK8493599.1 sigma-70 family RNA polymerase sigma factor [Corynebacterium pseudodiphtheriticum]MDK8499524.1 sigma-70 family RNA polymerase sigma factor [Corynebacterium pseudodiphtheriticum]MDK8545369.1 sigma-70 family RNA 